MAKETVRQAESKTGVVEKEVKKQGKVKNSLVIPCDQNFTDRSNSTYDKNSDIYNEYKNQVTKELTNYIIDIIESNMEAIITLFNRVQGGQYSIELPNTEQKRSFTIGNNTVSFNFRWFLEQRFYKWVLREAAENIQLDLWLSLSEKEEKWFVHCSEKTNQHVTC